MEALKGAKGERVRGRQRKAPAPVKARGQALPGRTRYAWSRPALRESVEILPAANPATHVKGHQERKHKGEADPLPPGHANTAARVSGLTPAATAKPRTSFHGKR